MSFLVVDPVWATTISDLKKQKEEAQKELDAVNSQINSLQGQQNTVLSQISQIDDSLVEILASISMIEDELNELTEEIARVQAEYDAAKAEEEEQYEAMKHRIKFMYEKGEIGRAHV